MSGYIAVYQSGNSSAVGIGIWFGKNDANILAEAIECGQQFLKLTLCRSCFQRSRVKSNQQIFALELKTECFFQVALGPQRHLFDEIHSEASHVVNVLWVFSELPHSSCICLIGHEMEVRHFCDAV